MPTQRPYNIDEQNFHNQTKPVLENQITSFVTWNSIFIPLSKKQISKTSSSSTEAMQKSFQTCFWNIAQIFKSHVAKTCQVFTYIFLQSTKSLTHEDSSLQVLFCKEFTMYPHTISIKTNIFQPRIWIYKLRIKNSKLQGLNSWMDRPPIRGVLPSPVIRNAASVQKLRCRIFFQGLG